MATHHDGDLVEAYNGYAHGGTRSRWADWAVLVVLPCLCLSAGCTMTSTPEAAQVRLVNELSQVAACRRLGEVRGRSTAPMIGWTAHTIDNARTKLRDGAVKQGGNTVLVTQSAPDVYGTSMYGDAYACPP